MRTKLAVVLEATLGGIRKHVVDLLLGLDSDIYDISFVYSGTRADQKFFESLKPLEEKGIAMIEVPMCRELHLWKDLKSLFAIVKIFRILRPDLIHVHGAKAGALGRLAALYLGLKNVIYTPHGGSFHKLDDPAGWLYLAVERVLLTRKLHFIGVSEYSCDTIRRRLRIQRDHLHCIYNGIDVREIEATKQNLKLTRSDFSLNADQFMVLYPALFLETKGQGQFVEMLARSSIRLNSNIVVVCVGDGPLLKSVQQAVADYELSEQFRFPGFQRNIYEYFNMADVVLLASTHEEFGYVLLESMAFAKPIVASAVGGIPELVQDQTNGIVIPNDSLETMITALNTLSRNPSECSRLGANGAGRLAREFSADRMICSTSKLYSTVLQQ